MKQEKPKHLYTIFATYPDYLDRMIQHKTPMLITKIFSTNAREANKKAREYASTGLYISVEVISTKDKRVARIL